MPASHNALLGALSRHAHLSEFTEPMTVNGNILTPQQRRSLAFQNLVGNTGEFVGENGVLRLPGNTLATTAGAGITGGVGAVYKQGVVEAGNLVRTDIIIDLTGLASSTTDADIIGVGASAAHIGQITAARNGTPFGGIMTCLEVPVGGVVDIDLFYATEATGVFDALITSLVEVSLISSAAVWTLNRSLAIADPAALADKYLYLVNGAAGVPGTYTAGKFLLSIYGYR